MKKTCKLFSPFRFEIIHQSSKSRARVGRIHTPHGIIDTPNFVAVGTNGTLKPIDSVFVDQNLNLQLMFVNTFHTLVHPGPSIIEKAGGIHKFINRTGPIITDSGGFQVFSLRHTQTTQSAVKELKGQSKQPEFQQNLVIKISEDGAKFRSYLTGDVIMLTPESSIIAQKQIGADIIIPLDELPPYSIDEKKLIRSLARTHRWEKRSLDEHLKNPKDQAIYSVIHGGCSRELRKQSVEYLCGLSGFDGHAIGGSLGKDRVELVSTVQMISEMLPNDKPIHLLGIGDCESIINTVSNGIDTYDSAYPTRLARHGRLLVDNGNLDIAKTSFVSDLTPIDAKCSCYTCKHYTRAYLHHLFKMKEQIYGTLAAIHNITYMVSLFARIRLDISRDLI